jgi:hypothetical protein
MVHIATLEFNEPRLIWEIRALTSPFSNRCVTTQLANRRALLLIPSSVNVSLCEKDCKKKCSAGLFDFAAPAGA